MGSHGLFEYYVKTLEVEMCFEFWPAYTGFQPTVQGFVVPVRAAAASACSASLAVVSLATAARPAEIQSREANELAERRAARHLVFGAGSGTTRTGRGARRGARRRGHGQPGVTAPRRQASSWDTAGAGTAAARRSATNAATATVVHVRSQSGKAPRRGSLPQLKVRRTTRTRLHGPTPFRKKLNKLKGAEKNRTEISAAKSAQEHRKGRAEHERAARDEAGVS